MKENTPRVIAAALAFFGGAAVLGWAAGIDQRFSAEELAALAFFAVTFGVLTYAVDRKVRDAVNGAIAALRGGSSPRDRTPGPAANIRT